MAPPRLGHVIYIGKQKQTFLSETTMYRALIFGTFSSPLPTLFKYWTWDQWPFPWGHMLYTSLFRENIKTNTA